MLLIYAESRRYDLPGILETPQRQQSHQIELNISFNTSCFTIHKGDALI